MTSFKDAFPSLDKFEGGLVFIKSEGQWTNKGIQFTTYKALCFQLLGVLPTEEHFKRLTRTEWGKFVKHYWDIATNNNSIYLKESAVILFTAFWGSGNRGLQKMQSALNGHYKANLATDGVIGERTVNVINKNRLSYKVLFSGLSDYWNDLAALPKYSAFRNGWNNRLAYISPGDPKFPIIATVLFLVFMLLKFKS